MGEYSAYLIPRDQDKLQGRADEVANEFWKLGIFLTTDSGKILNRLRETPREQLPATSHNFSFGGMGLADETFDHIVPANVYDAQCPKCGAEVFDDLCNAMTTFAVEDGPIQEMSITCSSCDLKFAAAEMKAPQDGFAFARNYLWISDIDHDADSVWEPEFQRTVETILGFCKIIIAWDT